MLFDVSKRVYGWGGEGKAVNRTRYDSATI
jgi:hypothetical protein